MTAQTRRSRDTHHTVRRLSTRFADNDVLGHINNATYYAYFDTAINGWLYELAGGPTWELPGLAVVASSSCDYLREVHYPQDLLIGLRVARLGTKSIAYELHLWAAGDPPGEIRARGRWVHVYIDPATRATVAIPPRLRAAIGNAIASIETEERP
ncbi:MAG: thioesterase family protein [Mycobacterium sp.]